MKLVNPGVNAYGPTATSYKEKNSSHPCYFDPCPFNLCGICPRPIAVAMC